MADNTPPPEPRWCPYCGHNAVKVQRLVPRCMNCRAVFHLSFSRWMRAARKPV